MNGKISHARASRVRNRIRLLVLLLTLVAFFGCTQIGGNDRYFSETFPSQSVVADTDAPLVRVGGDHSYPPFEFVNNRGVPDGFNIEILRRVAEIMHLHLSIELTPWAEARRRLQDGEVDMLAGMYRTPTRDALHDFTVPHFIASYGLFVRDGSRVQGAEELNDATIIVHRGDLGHEFVLQQGLGGSVLALPEWPDVIQALSLGKGDAAVFGMAQGMREIRNRGYRNVHMIETPLFQRPYAMAVSEGNSELLAQLNEGLSILKATGEFDEIYRRWFGVLVAQPWWSTRGARIAFVVLGALLLAVAVTGVWLLLLRNEVRRKTAQLTAALKESESSKRELELGNQTKIRFLANVSHELRTPLHGVMGMTDLLSKTDLDGAQRSLLNNVEDASQQLHRVLSDLLDLSRSVAGRLSIERATFNLNDLTRWLEPTLRHLAEGEGLSFEFSAELPEMMMHGDRERIGQILINLATNAVKFTDEGTVSVALRYEDEKLLIRVSDTGPGIPKEEQETIFDPFMQSERGRAHRAGGLGLGLSIVRSIVDQMQGTIEIESERDRGTTFFVRLPLKRAEPASPLPGRADKESRAEYEESGAHPIPVAVLVAEDEAINRLYLTAFLSRSGATITAASNGQEAVEAATSGEFDLILMDISMPKMDGLEATRRIRAWEKKNESTPTPIVALTAHAHAEQVELCYSAGMTAYLSKPYREQAVLKVIEELLQPAPAEGGTREEP